MICSENNVLVNMISGIQIWEKEKKYSWTKCVLLFMKFEIKLYNELDIKFLFL